MLIHPPWCKFIHTLSIYTTDSSPSVPLHSPYLIRPSQFPLSYPSLFIPLILSVPLHSPYLIRVSSFTLSYPSLFIPLILSVPLHSPHLIRLSSFPLPYPSLFIPLISSVPLHSPYPSLFLSLTFVHHLFRPSFNPSLSFPILSVPPSSILVLTFLSISTSLFSYFVPFLRSSLNPFIYPHLNPPFPLYPSFIPLHN